MKTKEGLIDELDEIVYISDTNTYELLYLNRPGRSVVGVDEEEYRGKKCYQVLQGRQEPCPFCTNGKLTAQGFYVWESANTYVDRHFIVKDKLVEWEGRTARMELAIDITEKENISQELRDRLEIANALIDCVSALVSGGSLDRTMAEMLRSVGEFYQADRVYIFEADCRRRLCSNTYEWCAPGVTPQRLALQNVPLAQVPRWVRAMEEKRPLIIGDLEEIREKAPQEYRLLRDQDIHSVGVMPFGSLDSPLAGYIGVDNPARFLGKVSLLESLSYFVMTEISKDRFSKELAYLGEHDTLTGLYNRNHYSQYLEDCQHSPRQRSSMGVMAGDINGLKRLNTDLGHAYGDRVVREVAGILLKNAPSAQSFRLGGDEFFLLWEDVGYEEFLGVMQRIKEELRGMERASVSIGYTWSDTDVDLQRLADHADELMLLSKQKYRRQAASGPGRSQAPLRRLLDALEKHRFLLYLQPKMQVSTGALAGAEALVRFEHPRHGIIPPDRFIPVLEKEQTIRYVDFFMLEEVYRTLTRWQEQGRPLVPIALNFSRATLLEPDLLEVLREVHSRYRVPRRLIQIEITESIGEVERETIARISTAIRKMGYSISLDDFGAKYTSISLLTMMRFDVLKLDRSLVEDLTKNRTSRIIVENVLRICRQLEVVCVAEGVETPAQLESLRELCCDQIQGYLFGRPMPLSDFEEHYMQ